MYKFDDSCEFGGNSREQTAKAIAELKEADPEITIAGQAVRLNAATVDCFKDVTNKEYVDVLCSLIEEAGTVQNLVQTYCEVYHEDYPATEQLFNTALSGVVNMLMDDLLVILKKNDVSEGHYLEAVKQYAVM